MSQEEGEKKRQSKGYEKLSLFINAYTLSGRDKDDKEKKRPSVLIEGQPQFNRRESKIYKMAPSIRGITRQVTESERTEQRAEEVKRLF